MPYQIVILQIMELVTSQPLIKFIEQLVDEDGSVKDSAVGQSSHLPTGNRFFS